MWKTTYSYLFWPHDSWCSVNQDLSQKKSQKKGMPTWGREWSIYAGVKRFDRDRWSGEYLKSLRKRHNMEHKTKEMNVKLGDVVLIQDAERNRGKWNMGIVAKLFQGRDGVVRAVGLRAGKSFLERALQHLFPLELSCDQEQWLRKDPTKPLPKTKKT